MCIPTTHACLPRVHQLCMHRTMTKKLVTLSGASPLQPTGVPYRRHVRPQGLGHSDTVLPVKYERQITRARASCKRNLGTYEEADLAIAPHLPSRCWFKVLERSCFERVSRFERRLPDLSYHDNALFDRIDVCVFHQLSLIL